MTLNSSMRTLTQQQQQQQHYRPSRAGGGSAVGQLLSKATVMDAIKQVRQGCWLVVLTYFGGVACRSEGCASTARSVCPSCHRQLPQCM